MKINRLATAIISAAILAAGIVFFAGCKKSATEIPGIPGKPETAGGKIDIVAAENFYGNIASQLGGDKVSVKSIISNPNADPHEYESGVEDAIAIAKARVVIKNGLEYDSWMDKMLAASPNAGRIVITAGEIAPKLLPYNPHVWYSIDNIMAIANAVTEALVKAGPKNKTFFENNLTQFDNSLAPLRAKMEEIKSRYSGTPVGLSETIYLYQTQPMGLKVLTPFAFEKAISEGNDPPAASVAAANNQVSNKEIRLLIYNSQAVTTITTNMQNAARARGIPVVPVSETMPPHKTYQGWIMDELNAVENGLAQGVH